MISHIAGRPLAVLDAPSNLGLEPPRAGREPGTLHGPAALRAHGLLSALGAEDAGAVAAPRYDPARAPDSGVRNVVTLADYAQQLGARVRALLDAGRFTLVLGGDCSILLGTMLGANTVAGRGARANRMTPTGLVFIDGHYDLQTPATTASGGAAGMDLALMLGLGPASLTEPLGRAGAILTPRDVALIGPRDEWAYYARDPHVAGLHTDLAPVPLGSIRARGPLGVATDALDRLAHCDSLWVHLDVDVLDPTLMPAVDSPDPGGLTYAELSALVVPLLSSGRVVGMDVTIYDPERDADGEAGGRR